MSSERKFLTQNEVADRLRINERTVEGWRWKGIGPAFHKIGGVVRYSLEDIEQYERSVRR